MTFATGFSVAFGAVMGYIAAGVVVFALVAGAFGLVAWLAGRR